MGAEATSFRSAGGCQLGPNGVAAQKAPAILKESLYPSLSPRFLVHLWVLCGKIVLLTIRGKDLLYLHWLGWSWVVGARHCAGTCCLSIEGRLSLHSPELLLPCCTGKN